jgi:replicative DNA helicase
MPIEITGTEEKAVIAMALDEPMFFSSIIDQIKTDYFSLDETKYVYKVIKFCYDNKGEIPTRSLVKALVEKTLTVDQENFRDILEICDYQINPRDYDLVKDRFITWLRSKTLDEVYHDNIIEAARNGNYTELEKIVERASRIQDLSGDYMWFFKDIEKIFSKTIEVKYTTGFPELDKYINEGGPTKGDVMVWMGTTGSGKCCSLQSKIIVEKLSAIYELEMENGKTIKLAGYKKIKTQRGEIMVCDLAKEDNIEEIPVEEDEGDIQVPSM